MAGITIRGLAKAFGARETSFADVSDLTLDIKDNQFVTLLGPIVAVAAMGSRSRAIRFVPDGEVIDDDRIDDDPEF